MYNNTSIHDYQFQALLSQITDQDSNGKQNLCLSNDPQRILSFMIPVLDGYEVVHEFLHQYSYTDEGKKRLMKHICVSVNTA